LDAKIAIFLQSAAISVADLNVFRQNNNDKVQSFEKDLVTLQAIKNNYMHEEKFMIYRRNAEKGEPTYSPKSHSAPYFNFKGHHLKGMEEWASWYCFNKKEDGTYEAELDEAWDEGSHYGGGTIRVDIPNEWFALSYDDFLERVITLAAATHYGFTVDDLKEKEGLKEFFGFTR